MKTLIVLLIALTVSVQAAPVGTAFTYQGRLTDSSGVPMSGSYDLSFKLFDALTGGSQVGSTVTITGVTVTGGLFAVRLDFGTTAFNGQQRWLETAVGAQTLSPRVEITPAPNAIYSQTVADASVTSGKLASDAASLAKVSGGAISAWGGNIGVGTTYPGAKLDVNGTVRMTGFNLPDGAFPGKVLTSDVTGNGTWSSEPWSLVGNAATNSLIHYIGTTDNQPFCVRVNGVQQGLKIEPVSLSTGAPNFIGGSGWNTVTAGACSGTVFGGGQATSLNKVTDSYCTVAGGHRNIAGNDSGTVDDALACFVGAGQTNIASGNQSVVVGGYNNTASNGASCVLGGGYNQATGPMSSVGGGSGNVASGYAAAIAGGSDNRAAGDSSFAAGYGAEATHANCFVWGGGQGNGKHTPSAGAYTVTVRAHNGIWFGRDGDTVSIPAGQYISTGTGGFLSTGGTWTNSSDRSLKSAFVSVDALKVLDKLAAMPINTWSYKAEDPGTRHIGPTAQDFAAAFGLGSDDKHIATVDADGIALASIQALYRQLQEKEAKITDLQKQIDELKVLVTSYTGVSK